MCSTQTEFQVVFFSAEALPCAGGPHGRDPEAWGLCMAPPPVLALGGPFQQPPEHDGSVPVESFSLEAAGIAEANKTLPVLLSLVTIPADLVTTPADPVTIPQYSGTNAAEAILLSAPIKSNQAQLCMHQALQCKH